MSPRATMGTFVDYDRSDVYGLGLITLNMISSHWMDDNGMENFSLY
jgi:hypothetical protein